MKFKELVEDILIESTREYTPMNIISLINHAHKKEVFI